MIASHIALDGYLPGLRPDWTAKNVAELIADFNAHQANPSASMLDTYRRLIYGHAEMSRSLIVGGETSKEFVEIYAPAATESLTLLELQNRLSRSLKIKNAQP